MHELFIGVDGCKRGWIAAILDNNALRIEKYQTMHMLIGQYPVFDAFLIDMVIGLRDNIDQLRPDDLARKQLKPRGSTLFPVPSRAATYANTYDEQKEANLRTLGKSLSKQTSGIIPKIREMDEFFKDHEEYKNRIDESHPELSFARLNGAVMLSKKKELSGIEERMQIMKRYLPGIVMPDPFLIAKDLKCNVDDIVDAMCLAITARLKIQGECETIPQDPEKDSEGLYMKLTIPKIMTGNRIIGT